MVDGSREEFIYQFFHFIAICDSIDAMSLNCCYRKAVLEHWDYVVGNEKEKYKKEGDKCKIK